MWVRGSRCRTKPRIGVVDGTAGQISQTPLNTDHRGRVAPVQGVLVVEMLAPSHGLLEACSPKRERFTPCHANVVVQFAVAQERALAGRPQRVVHNASFELPQRVLGGARVIGGGTPREAGPFGKIVDTIGLIGGKNVVPRMFSNTSSSSRYLSADLVPTSAASRAMRIGEIIP